MYNIEYEPRIQALTASMPFIANTCERFFPFRKIIFVQYLTMYSFRCERIVNFQMKTLTRNILKKVKHQALYKQKH